MSFGHLGVAVDWAWMRAIQEEDIFHVPRGKHPPSYYDYDLATDLDPAFFEVYVAAGAYLPVIRDDFDGAAHLLRRAADFHATQQANYPAWFWDKFWRDAWKIHMLQGYIQLFHLDNVPLAAKAFSKASSFPNAPLYLKNMDERLRTPGGQYEVGIRLLTFMIEGLPRSSEYQNKREEFERKKHFLLVSQYLYTLSLRFQDYLSRLPEYRTSLSVSPGKMTQYWKAFLKSSHISIRDPWGGMLSLDPAGKIDTSTAHEKVFGLE